MVADIQNQIRKIDSEIRGILERCRELESLAGTALNDVDEWNQTGPFRWRESCDCVIAKPRDVINFQIELRAPLAATSPGTFQVQLRRALPSNMVFYRIQSVLINEKEVRPENQSLNRSFFLAFNRIHPDSTILISYQTRVVFDATPSRVVIGDTNLKWNWVASEAVIMKPLLTTTDSMLRVDPKLSAIGRMHHKKPSNMCKLARKWQVNLPETV